MNVRTAAAHVTSVVVSLPRSLASSAFDVFLAFTKRIYEGRTDGRTDADGRRTTQIRKEKEKEKKNYARVVRNGATAMATDGRSRQSRVVRITVPKADETDDVPFGHSDGRRTDGIEDDD